MSHETVQRDTALQGRRRRASGTTGSWQVRNRLTTLEDFDQVLHLTDEQRDDIKRCMGKFRVAVTPYYASLMDPDDEHCPVRVQGVPSPARSSSSARAT